MVNGYLKSIFAGFLAGSIIAIILTQWIFLEMRGNIAIAIPLSTLGGVVFYRFSRIEFQIKFVVFLELVFGLFVFLLYNFSFESYSVIPASMFRDGFYLNSLSLKEINIIIILILGIANFLLFGKLRWPLSFFSDNNGNTVKEEQAL